MASKKRKIPRILLLILSTLGILFGAAISVLSFAGSLIFSSDNLPFSDFLSITTTGILSLTVCILNVPTFFTSIKDLKQKPSPHPLPDLFRKANFLIGVWLLLILAGFLISQNESNTIFLAPLTTITIAIPVWWLVEFSRRGLPRSTKLREWGTLSIGITLTPVVIIMIELIIVAIVILSVMIDLGIKNNFNDHLNQFLQNINLYQSGIGEQKQILYDLMNNPIIAKWLFLTVGLIAPLIEEIFKPFAIWLLLNRPLRDYEGFSLGLISGGAFTLLESAGMVLQLNAQDWLTAILLRATTSVLHIGLSGLVGFGITRNWNKKQYWKGLFYIISAALLHGSWNSLALLSGFSFTLNQSRTSIVNSSAAGILVLGGMITLFVVIIVITLKINTHLQYQITAQEIE